MKKIPLIHGKFRAKNNPMKFHFAVFMGHEMIFMGFSHEIHGIFIKLQFIVSDPSIFQLTDFVNCQENHQSYNAYPVDNGK